MGSVRPTGYGLNFPVTAAEAAAHDMRNAGDLETAADLYDAFQVEAARYSKELSLATTHAAFSLPRSELEQRYFDLFDAICDEIRAAQGSAG